MLGHWTSAMPSHLLRSDCLHPIAAPRLAACKPHHPLRPRAQPLQPVACNIIIASPAFASTRSQRSCRRCRQRTPEFQPPQLRHPSETWCQRRCPIISDPIVCTPPPPLGPPIANLATHYSPARNRPNPQPATTSSAHSRRSQTPAHSAAAADTQKRTFKLQPHQLRHPFEARCQRR
jgi:hypothetical protein